MSREIYRVSANSSRVSVRACIVSRPLHQDASLHTSRAPFVEMSSFMQQTHTKELWILVEERARLRERIKKSLKTDLLFLVATSWPPPRKRRTRRSTISLKVVQVVSACCVLQLRAIDA
eukprot:g67065.t1